MEILRDVKVVAIGLALAGLAALLFADGAAAASTGSIGLIDARARLRQTGTQAWTLSKSGTVNPANSTVTWTVTAVQGATVAGQLIINGRMIVTNYGSGAATIGNVVVNLQSRSGLNWLTRSSDVADATHNDGATSARVVAAASSEHQSTFTENAASGRLLFGVYRRSGFHDRDDRYDRDDDFDLDDGDFRRLLPLVPQVSIKPGETVSLLFSARFNNDVLGLATGSQVRAEIIVTFGNAAKSATSATNLDINGNGTIDADEAMVRSVPARFVFNLPAPATVNSPAPTLTDTLADITTTGTVTFTNAIFNLGATTGTVRVTYAGGASGGSITNCGHLDGIGVALTACNTQAIAADGWTNGDVITYSQAYWSDDPTASNALATNYSTVYAPSGTLEVGISGSGGFSMAFTNAGAVLAYLPASGSAGALNADLVNPTSSASGVFGGETVALQLNVDFSDQGFTLGASGIRFGNLRICGVAGFHAQTVRQVLATANSLLGSGSSSNTIAQVHAIAQDLNTSFGAGLVSQFAADHLFPGSCP